MAKIKQVGVGRKTTGTIDGITYVTRGGVTYARSAPTMPASAYSTPAAKKRQALFKFIQMHLKYHLRTIKQTFTPKGNGTPCNRYFSLNSMGLTAALDTLAEQYCAGVVVTIDDVEDAIATYATTHPKAITIASKSGYQEVYLTGAWPGTITLNANSGDSTVIIIVAENGTTTTISSGGGQAPEPSSGGEQTGGGSGTTTVTAPTISGTTPFSDSTQVTITGPAGANIYYTTDGSTPTSSSTLYSSALSLSDTTTVKAIAIKDGQSSSVTTKVFTKSEGGGGTGDDNDGIE
jgi:hypothetical protein